MADGRSRGLGSMSHEPTATGGFTPRRAPTGIDSSLTWSERGECRVTRPERLRTREARLGVRFVAVVGAAVLLAGCSLPDWGSDNGATEQGRDIFRLWQWSVLGAVLVGALIWGLVLFVVFRYRRRKRAEAGLPTQRQYIIGLEVFYTIVPIVIVAVLFGYSYVTQTSVDALTDDPDYTVDVVGFQWQWQFEYAGENVTITGFPDEHPVMVLPVGKTVRLRLRSRDVIHSFYVPGFLFKRDVIPGVLNEFDFDVTETGTFSGHCAEFCGLDHADMIFTVETVPSDEFEDWLDDHRNPVDNTSGTTTTSSGDSA